MPPAQQNQVVDVRCTALLPGHKVMGIQMSPLMAARETARAVADAQCAPLRRRREALCLPQMQHLPTCVAHNSECATCAHQPESSRCLERWTTTHMAARRRITRVVGVPIVRVRRIVRVHSVTACSIPQRYLGLSSAFQHGTRDFNHDKVTVLPCAIRGGCVEIRARKVHESISTSVLKRWRRFRLADTCALGRIDALEVRTSRRICAIPFEREFQGRCHFAAHIGWQHSTQFDHAVLAC